MGVDLVSHSNRNSGRRTEMLRQIFPAFTTHADDVRLRMLMELLQTLQQGHAAGRLAALTTDALVACLVEAIHRCRFPPDSYRMLKALSVQDSQPAFRCYAESIRNALADLDGGCGPISIVSIGCGAGDIERFLDKTLQESILAPATSPPLRWIGVDRTAPNSESFFLAPGNRFVAADIGGQTRYLDLAQVPRDAWHRSLLIGSYAVHHLGIRPDEFLHRCEGFARVVLLEELTTEPNWTQWHYRAARVGWDLLSNIGFNPDWADCFMEQPGQFKVRYLFREEVAQYGGRVIDVTGCSPEMSVVIF